MSPDLEDGLQQRFGKYFSDSMTFSFSHGDGWYRIIESFLQSLVNPVMSAKANLDRVERRFTDKGTDRDFYSPVTVADVDAAKLRLANAMENLPSSFYAKEQFGELSITYNSQINPTVDALIDFAEQMSAVTCEICGNFGKHRNGSWDRTLCNHHAEKLGYMDDMQ